MQNILEYLYQGKFLNHAQIERLLFYIINNQLSPVQIAAALISMKVRSETVEEIIGATNTILAYSKKFCPRPNVLFADITGTGGDRKNTINISTISAIVASICGAKIIKHGNYSTSGITGSIDTLQKHNIYTEIHANQSLNLFHKLGICFLCAAQYYTVFKNIMHIRKQLQTPTLFNIIGPLLNPSRPTLTLIGVYKKELLLPMIQVLKTLQYVHAIVVHCDGIDEIGLHAPTNIFELYNNTIENYILIPSDFGLNSYPIEELFCDSKKTAQNHMINILKGKGKKSHTEVIAANVSLLLKLFGYHNLQSNVSLVLDKIYQGKAYNQLLALSELSSRYYNNEHNT